MSSPIRLLMAPRAAERRCRTSMQGSSWFRARSTPSSCPTIFLVRLTRSSFSLDKCDIGLDYPMGVWYQSPGPDNKARKGNTTWKFRLQNPDLRAVRASRTFTANEHSIGRWESVLPLAFVTAIKNRASGNPHQHKDPRPIILLEEALEFQPEHPRGCKRGAMFKFIIGNRKAVVPHASLYC